MKDSPMPRFYALLLASVLLLSPAYGRAEESSAEMKEKSSEDAALPEALPEEDAEKPATEKAPVKQEKPKEKPKQKPKPEAKPKAKEEKPKDEKPEISENNPLPLTKPAADYVMLRVGTQDVPASEVKHMWEGLFPAGAAPSFEELKPEMRDRVLRGIVAERVLLSEAIKQGMDKTESVQRDLEDIRRKMLVKALLDSKTADISDAELQSAYQEMVVAMKDEKEIRARHILVGTEKEAKEVQKLLESGKNFEEVARDYSKDPASAKQGGDLGYFTRDKMVTEFADAAFGLKKGETSSPTKSSFGWHIIKVEDIRPVAPPTLNDAKESLKTRLQEKRLSEYVRTLVQQTSVKRFDSKGAELPFNKDTAQDHP